MFWRRALQCSLLLIVLILILLYSSHNRWVTPRLTTESFIRLGGVGYWLQITSAGHDRCVCRKCVNVKRGRRDMAFMLLSLMCYVYERNEWKRPCCLSTWVTAAEERVVAFTLYTLLTFDSDEAVVKQCFGEVKVLLILQNFLRRKKNNNNKD